MWLQCYYLCANQPEKDGSPHSLDPVFPSLAWWLSFLLCLRGPVVPLAPTGLTKRLCPVMTWVINLWLVSSPLPWSVCRAHPSRCPDNWSSPASVRAMPKQRCWLETCAARCNYSFWVNPWGSCLPPQRLILLNHVSVMTSPPPTKTFIPGWLSNRFTLTLRRAAPPKNKTGRVYSVQSEGAELATRKNFLPWGLEKGSGIFLDLWGRDWGWVFLEIY